MLAEANKDEVISRFNRDVKGAITLCNFHTICETLELAPGVISVMDSDLNMMIFYSTRRHKGFYFKNPSQHQLNSYLKNTRIGILPFYIKGELSLQGFVRENITLGKRCHWHKSYQKISLEEEERAAA